MTTNSQELTAMLTEALATQSRLIGAIENLIALEVAGRDKRYVSLETLVDRLGDGFAGRRILADLREGYFKQGRDYVVAGGGSEKPRYGFWVEGVREIYKLPPENRRTY
jgi:hypothetical protein